MTLLTKARRGYSVRQLDDRAQPDVWRRQRYSNAVLVDSGSAAEAAFLAVVVPSPTTGDAEDSVRWQAELELVERSRVLPIEWPLSDWLSDYRDLLSTALAEQKTATGSTRWILGVGSFLNLMLSGQDHTAAQFVRAFTHSRPPAEETRKISHVQALFASIRPARSMAEALGVRIVTRPVLAQ
jgi:hypothetical protein